jgi:hypothetical protein
MTDNQMAFIEAYYCMLTPIVTEPELTEFFTTIAADLDYGNLRHGSHIMDYWLLWNEAIKQPKSIVITVEGGVADYICDDGINVLLLDIDNIREGDGLTYDDIEGFDDVLPDWVADYIEEDELTYTMLAEGNSQTHMTCGRGSVLTTYDRLVELFGQPYATNCGKTQVEWDIEWSDGTISTIYDWKCYDYEPEEITEWNIGGNSYLSADHVKNLLK